MKAFDPNPKLRWLFCLTHPDDELAIGAWIKRLTKAGTDVFLSWTHDTPGRASEASAAARLLGAPQQRLFFHHGVDQRILEQISKLKVSFEQMVHEVRPDRIVCGAFEQGHIDHDATNYLVNRVFKGPVLEFPLYHTYSQKIPKLNRFAQPEGEETLLLDPKEQAFKVMLAKQYPSQTIWRNVFWYEVWQGLRFQPRVLKKIERMRIQTHKDFLTPNLPPALAQRVLASAQWKHWQKTIRKHEASAFFLSLRESSWT